MTASQLKLVVSNKKLTTEQRIQVLTASGLTEQEAQQTLVTMGLVTAEGAATTATFSLSGAFKALGAAIAANPIGFILTALTTAITVISTVNSKLDEARQKEIDAGNEAAEAANEILELANTYLELADAVDQGTASKDEMIAAQDDLVNALELEKGELDELIAKYGDYKSAIIEATREKLSTDISVAVKGANTAKKQASKDSETWLGTGAYTTNKDDEKAIIKYLYDQGLINSDSAIGLPHLDATDVFSDLSFDEIVENRNYLEKAMNAVREEFGSDSAAFDWLSDAYQKYADSVDPAIKAIDNANKLIADDLILAQRAIADPTTQEEFDNFRQTIIDNLKQDIDFDENGTMSAEGLVDSILSTSTYYQQFMEDLGNSLDAASGEIEQYSNKIGQTLAGLWASENFSDTKKQILELAQSLDGITADNIKYLISDSAELAAVLDEDGMNAQFLAHILQTEAMGGDGFALITDDALTLNEALEGLTGRFGEVTDAISRYNSAISIDEKDSNFKSYADAFEKLNEQFVAGTTNSNTFWAAAEFLFGSEQLQAWGWADGLDKIYSAMQKNVDIFKDADSAGAGFLDRLYAISEAGEIKADDGSVIAEIEKLSDGSYDFQFDSGNLDALADKLGITSEAALACMEALSMYGDFNFYDMQAVMDAIDEIGLSSDALNGTAVNVGTLTDQLVSLGKTDKEIYDLLNALQAVDGVTLLDANANVEMLKQNLTDLGLAAQDGVSVNVNVDGLADLMSQLNFTKEDTQNLIKKLDEADGITLTNAQGEVTTLNDALAHTDELEFASVTSELDGITSSADLAQQAVDDLQQSIRTLKGKTVTVTVDVQRKSGILGSIFGYAKGTKDAPEGDALVGEEGEELVQSGDRAYLVGTNGPEITHLDEGDIVYTAEQTKKIKRGSTAIRGVVPAYAGGRLNTNKGYTSVLPTSTKTSTKTTTKAVADAAKSLEESLEDTLKAMADTLDDVLGNFEHNIFLMEHNSTDVSQIIATYKAMQDAIHDQAEKYRGLGLGENSDYLQDLQKQWWDYNDSIEKLIISTYDDAADELKNAVTLSENWLDQAIANNDRGAIIQYTSDIVSYYQQMQDTIHEQAEYYRSLGYSDTSNEVSKLSDLWWDYFDEIKSVSANAWQQVVDNANEALDNITGLYDTLKDAAETYAESGFITVKNLQDICSWGVQYLAYLQDENGYLVINEENIQKVIAARTQQMAIETALNYVQQLREALTNNDTVALMNLTTATQVAATSTWDLVYAQLQLLGLDTQQYNNALNRVNTLRSLTDITVSGIGRTEGAIREANEAAKKALEEQSDALNDLLKYVEEMIKQEVENQVKALEDQIDSYREIVDLQKKSLDMEREKDEYTKSVAEKEKAIADLRKQIAILDMDDSREAAAQKAKLQEELSEKIVDLSDYQADHAYDATSDMLDSMADAYEKEKRTEIDVLENTISSEEKLYRLAIERIETQWGSLYQQLIDWNTEYGTVTNSEITSAWDAASTAVQQYGSYLNAVLETQRQIAAYEASSSSYSSTLGTTGNSILGKVGDYDTSGGAYSIVAKMQANSSKWWGLKEANNQAGLDALEADQQNLAQQLRQALPGMNIERKSNGTWYINGEELYKSKYAIYHDGGIAGDNPTLKQKELMAKLEKGEAIIPEDQQEPLFEILDYEDSMLGKYGKLFSAMRNTDLMTPMVQDQIKQDTQQAQSIVERGGDTIYNNVTVPVHAMQKLDPAEVAKLSKDISNRTITELNDAFIKRGKHRTSNPLKP